MTEPNPSADGEYTWGPAHPQGTPDASDAAGHPNTPGASGMGGATGAPEYDFPGSMFAEGRWGPQPTPAYGYPHPTAGYGYPGPSTAFPAPVGGPGAPLLSIGDITVVNDAIITPAGTLPLRGAVWNATDMSRTEEKIPTYAVVLAIVFALLCLVGLFFLLMKEKTTTGFVQITVTSGGKHHATMVPAHHPGTFQMVMGQIGYARSLSSM
ncbi:hypothetical protein [Streptomyces sp. NPDC051569]|uniref:hypothetical protein n=1 Tax=Streptomyces sp. NPDC051569 TaxID=3365661 RepID=UPI0037A37099